VEKIMKDPKSKNATPGKQGGLNAEIQSRIGHQLRAMYDRFADLIRKLDASDASPQMGTAGEKNDGRD
jgi:hypothetical protein